MNSKDSNLNVRNQKYDFVLMKLYQEIELWDQYCLNKKNNSFLKLNESDLKYESINCHERCNQTAY